MILFFRNLMMMVKIKIGNMIQIIVVNHLRFQKKVEKVTKIFVKNIIA